MIQASGLTKFGEQRAFAKNAFGHGHANGVDTPVAGDAVLDEVYAGPKAAMRPIHETLPREIGKFGVFEIAPE